MPSHRTEKKVFNFKGPFAAERGAIAKTMGEQGKHQLASVLAQIDLASCFRNEEEPLFSVLSPLIYKAIAE